MAAIEKLQEDLAIISKLGDNPGTDNGLTTEGLRAKFDEAALIIQRYLNEVIVPAIGATSSPDGGLEMNGTRIRDLGDPIAPYDAVHKQYVDDSVQNITAESIGARPATWLPSPDDIGAEAKHIAMTIALAADGWVNNSQTVVINGLAADDTVFAGAAAESHSAYQEAGVYCAGQAEGALTFKCEAVPETAVMVNVVVFGASGITPDAPALPAWQGGSY